MKCYVAGRTSDMRRVRRIQEAATKAGHVITFDWTGPEGMVRKSWTGYEAEGARLSQREVAAAQCELFILATPNETGGVGCFVEFGIALGHGALCYVFPFLDRDSVFFRHPNVWILQDWEALQPALGIAETRYKLLHKPPGRRNFRQWIVSNLLP